MANWILIRNFVCAIMIIKEKHHGNDKLTFKYVEIAKFNKKEDELVTLYDKWLYVLKNLSRLDFTITETEVSHVTTAGTEVSHVNSTSSAQSLPSSLPPCDVRHVTYY